MRYKNFKLNEENRVVWGDVAVETEQYLNANETNSSLLYVKPFAWL